MLRKLSWVGADGRRGREGGRGKELDEANGSEPDARLEDECEALNLDCDDDRGGGRRSDARLVNLSCAGEDEGPPSVRDFFQICSVGDGRSSISFRFFVRGTGRRGGGSSSSESSVRSMMSVAWERGGCELPTLTD